MISVLRHRIQAVDRDAGPDEVEMQIGAGQHGRRVRQVPDRPQPGRPRLLVGPVEAFGLPVDGGVFELVGARQVRPHRHDFQVPVGLRLRRVLH